MAKEKPIKPTLRFWLVITVDRADGTLGTDSNEWNCDCVQGVYSTEALATDALKDQIEECGGTGFVYACTPKQKAWKPAQPPIRVVAL